MDVGDDAVRINRHVLPAGSFSVGDKAISIRYKGRSRVFNGSASVGGKVKVIQYKGKRRVISSPLDILSTYSYFSGYGETYWELLIVAQSHNPHDCARVYLVERIMDSDNLKIKKVKYITRNKNAVLIYNPSTKVYSWMGEDFDSTMFRWGAFLATDDEMIFLHDGSGGGPNKIYYLNKNAESWDDLLYDGRDWIGEPAGNFDGDYIYVRTGGETRESYIAKISLDDLSQVALSPQSGMYPTYIAPTAICGDWVMVTRYYAYYSTFTAMKFDRDDLSFISSGFAEPFSPPFAIYEQAHGMGQAPGFNGSKVWLSGRLPYSEPWGSSNWYTFNPADNTYTGPITIESAIDYILK